MTRKPARIAVLAAGGVLVLTALAAGSTAATHQRAASGPIKIGISLSLSGDFSDPGKAAQRGYKLWAKVVNAKGGVLGRQVQLLIRDDTSSPTQAATNYQTLITKDKVDLVFGPFSTLLTAPSAAVANRYGYSFIEPAGGGPAVFQEKLHNVFFTQPAPVVQSADVFAKFLLSLPKSERPKTASYPSLDDPFASPIADRVRSLLEKAGVKTIYKTIYPSETTDMGPVIQKVASGHPDAVIAGTQSEDAYAQVKAMVQAEVQPEVRLPLERRQQPRGVPGQGRRQERQRDLQHAATGSRRRRTRGTRRSSRPTTRPTAARRHRPRLGGGVRGRTGRRGRRGEDPLDRQQEDHLDAAHRQLADRRRRTALELRRGAAGQRPARRVDQREAVSRVSGVDRAAQALRPETRPGAVSERGRRAMQVRSGSHPRAPDRGRLRAHGERADARVRDHEGDQRGPGRARDSRRVPELRALLAPAHRPVSLDPDRHAGDVRARRGGPARVRPVPSGAGRTRALAARHLGARTRDRGRAQRHLQDDLPRHQSVVRRSVVGRSSAISSASSATFAFVASAILLRCCRSSSRGRGSAARSARPSRTRRRRRCSASTRTASRHSASASASRSPRRQARSTASSTRSTRAATTT